MTADEIRVAAQLTSGIQINSVTGFTWVKEGLKIICQKYNRNGETVVDSTVISDAPSVFTPTKEILGLVSVKSADSDKSASDNAYELNDDGTITFNKKGNYKIEYKSYAEVPATPATPIKLFSAFEECLGYYVAYKIRARLFGEGDNNAVGYYSKFLTEMEDGEKTRLKKKQKRRMPPGRG